MDQETIGYAVHPFNCVYCSQRVLASLVFILSEHCIRNNGLFLGCWTRDYFQAENYEAPWLNVYTTCYCTTAYEIQPGQRNYKVIPGDSDTPLGS